MSEDERSDDISRRDFLGESARSAFIGGPGWGREGVRPPDWPVFARLAESGRPHVHWAPAPAPPGIRPGETVVGAGRKNLILGTLAVASPAPYGPSLPRRRVIQEPTFPCGLFVGQCRTLAQRWSRIEGQILDLWGIPSRGGGWVEQRPFYNRLRDWHLGFFADCPGLIWVVPFWVLTINKRMEAELDPTPRIRVRRLEFGELPCFGPPGLAPDVTFTRRALRGLRLQGAVGEEDIGEIIVVNRNRLRRDGVALLADNYFVRGSFDDDGVRERGISRATENYFQRIDGWRLHGAWAILTAAFKGTASRCTQVIYTHQVLDPFTHLSHDIGLIRIAYSPFWTASYGLAEMVDRLMP